MAVKTTRSFVGGGSRYAYDMKLLKHGYVQYDTSQDAWYFGVWVNVDEMKIFTYAEGDECLQEFDDRDEFKNELLRMGEFYGDPPPAMITIDDDGTMTKYYDARPTGEVVA